MLRVFFALWPDDGVREQVHAYQQQLALNHCRPMLAANFHITLSFLGQVGDDSLAALTELSFARTVAPFDLQLDRTGWWKRPRVVWLAPASWPEALNGLVAGINLTVGGLGLAVDARPYKPHLTLARKVAKRPRLPRPDPIPWNINDFSLVLSETLEGGARYRVVKNWPLS